TLTLALHDPDFVTASRVVQAVNTELGPDTAKAIDPATVVLRVPLTYRSAVPDLMARLDVLPVETDAVAKVVINERTGTVVVGGHVQIGPAAVAHGNLSVRITTRYEASQPQPFARTGETKVVPNQQVEVEQERARLEG